MSKYVPRSQQTSAIPWRSIDRLLAGDDSRAIRYLRSVSARQHRLLILSLVALSFVVFVRSEKEEEDESLSICVPHRRQERRGREELIAIVYSSKRSWP